MEPGVNWLAEGLMSLGTRRATMYWRKCETRRSSAPVNCVTGVFDWDEVVDDGVMLSDMCCIVSGRLACLPENCSEAECCASSNRSKTITLGSDFVLDFVLLPVLETVLALCRELVCLLVL